MSNGAADGASKGNEYAIEALKQVLTLASAILALTVTFLKDALGEARAEARLQFLIPMSWFLLLVVIWTAWITLATAARAIGTSGQPIRYVFDKGTTARFWALVAEFSFVLALTALVAFAVANRSLYFRAPPKPAVTVANPAGPAPTLFDYVGRIGPFQLGSENVLEPGAQGPEGVTAELNVRGRSGEVAQIVLIGSVDKFALANRARAHYGSNVGLARARAEWAATRLLEGMVQRAPHVILTSGPLEHGGSLSQRDTALDRSVSVYLLWRRRQG
jgi:hypothetical protein